MRKPHAAVPLAPVNMAIQRWRRLQGIKHRMLVEAFREYHRMQKGGGNVSQRKD